jgi:hypothetical protein
VVVDLLDPVDNGPFYLRFPVAARCPRTGERGRGFAEIVKPGQVDIPWMRPFVRMRCHRLDGINSPLLPLFSGPRRGRLRRTLGNLRRVIANPRAYR